MCFYRPYHTLKSCQVVWVSAAREEIYSFRGFKFTHPLTLSDNIYSKKKAKKVTNQRLIIVPHQEVSLCYFKSPCTCDAQQSSTSWWPKRRCSFFLLSEWFDRGLHLETCEGVCVRCCNGRKWVYFDPYKTFCAWLCKGHRGVCVYYLHGLVHHMQTRARTRKEHTRMHAHTHTRANGLICS